MRKLTITEREARWSKLPWKRKRVVAARTIAEAHPVHPMMFRRTAGTIKPGFFGVVNAKALELIAVLPAALILAVFFFKPESLLRWYRLAATLPHYYGQAFKGHFAWRKLMREIINSSDGTAPGLGLE